MKQLGATRLFLSLLAWSLVSGGMVLAQADGAARQLPPGDGIAPRDSPAEEFEDEKDAVEIPAVEAPPDVADPEVDEPPDVVQPDVEE